MINLFIDYLRVLFEKVNKYSVNLLLSQSNNKPENIKSSSTNKKSQKTANFNESLLNREAEKEQNESYINEIKTIFILFQNFMYNNKEKETLFCNIYLTKTLFKKIRTSPLNYWSYFTKFSMIALETM
jgi:hypothetical protein